MKRLLLAGSMVALLSGCAFFSTPPSKPIIEDRVGSEDAKDSDKRIGTLATVAQRRLVLIKFNNGQFCAEPSPDTADNISASLSAALSANLQSGASDLAIGANAQLATSLATIARQLFYRTQGLQLYRDGMFSLCNAYLNGTLDTETYMKKQGQLLNISKELISAEIPHIEKIKNDTSSGATAPQPATLTIPPPATLAPKSGASTPAKP
jgi:hypothetical protein